MWSGDPHGGLEVVGIPSRTSGSGCETLPEVRKWLEALSEVWDWLGDSPGGPEMVERPSRRSVSS